MIEKLPPLNVAAFDSSAGAAGSLSRLRTAEADGRWRCRYVTMADGDRLSALVPLYRPSGATWPDPAYAPARWPFEDAPPVDVAPEQCVVVGGVYDRRTALHIAPDERVVREALVKAASVAAADSRCLVFPFVYERARTMLDAVTDGRVVWSVLGREAHFADVLDADREARLTAQVRRVLRRDRRLLDQVGTVGSVGTWDPLGDGLAELIAEHNIRLGASDHPEFVRLRYEQWSTCDDVRVVVFDVRAGSLRGVLTTLVWRDGLEVYEVGLPYRDDPARHAIYLDLMFHRTFEYARANGLRHIRAGAEASTPKAFRGATFEALYGGVLGCSDTRSLARCAP